MKINVIYHQENEQIFEIGKYIYELFVNGVIPENEKAFSQNEKKKDHHLSNANYFMDMDFVFYKITEELSIGDTYTIILYDKAMHDYLIDSTLEKELFNDKEVNFDNILVVDFDGKTHNLLKKAKSRLYFTYENNLYDLLIFCLRDYLQVKYNAVYTKNNPLNIFLSYRQTPEDKELSEKIKVIVEQSKLRQFIDLKDVQRDISEIEEALEECHAVMVLYSDYYASSPYCVKELEMARLLLKPIAIVETFKYENDRLLQHLGNLKLFLRDETQLESMIKRIILYLLFNIFLGKQMENELSDKNTQPEHVKNLPFQPSHFDLSNEALFKADSNAKTTEFIIYPEPIIQKGESERFSKMVNTLYKDNYRFCTKIEYDITQLNNGMNEFFNYEDYIQISFSNVSNNDLNENHVILTQLVDLVSQLTRYMFRVGIRIAYIGSFNPSFKPNFTKILLKNMAEYHHDFLKSNIEEKHNNYMLVSRRIYDKKEEIKYIEEYREQKLLANNTFSFSKKTETLDEDRVLFSKESKALIVLGGQTKKNENSGILKEILLYLDKEKPVYLITKFGGVAKAFSEFINRYIESEDFDESIKLLNSYMPNNDSEMIISLKQLKDKKSVENLLNCGLEGKSLEDFLFQRKSNNTLILKILEGLGRVIK